ncbi:unnamed protein product [Durusdinium trenchii]|uniref:Integrase catalytic domain-containing protein n=1 Tax=Durusdinium trenchii TaxID=1381693 RepID=A0ABP0J2P3_9DINO
MATSSLVDSLPNGWTHAELAELEETLATETGADPGALTSDSRPWRCLRCHSSHWAPLGTDTYTQSEDQRAADPAREAGVPLPAMLPIEARGKGVGKSSDDSELLKVMKQLLEERKNDKSSQSSWDTRKGPSPGIKWKGGTPPNPPKWNYSSSDLRAFSKFEREAEAESEHMELSRVNDKNGVDYILSCLKGPLEQKVLYQKRALLANYEVVARTANETIRQYINRYKRIERDLQAVGIQTGKGGYPPRKVFQAEHETAHEAENEDELAMADMAAEDEEFFEPEENPDASPPVDPDPDQEDDDDLGASLSELASVLTALAKEEKARARLQLGGPNPRLPLVVTYGDEQPQDPQDPFYTFPANLMVDVPDAPFVYVTETIDLAGYMVLDTACSMRPMFHDLTMNDYQGSGYTREEFENIMECYEEREPTSDNPDQYHSDLETPIDYATGWDLQKTAHLDQLKPLILIQGIDCRDWCILQDNTNYVRRKILLLMRRAKARRLLKKVCQWCRKQVDEGRMFLLENPTTSRIWFEPVMTSLLNLPGVTTITCHAGSYGAQDSEGNMIRKGHRFMGNCPHVLARLSRKLTPDQQKQCVPLQGKETTLSQHYPPEMVAEILRGVREEVHHRHPDRQRQPRTFFTTFMVTAVDQWAEALQMADSTFQVTRYKSFTLPTSDPLFLKALELSQWKHMERVQIPGGFPGTCLTHRAAVLRYTDGQVDVIEEDLQELRHPKARFKKPVDVGIFMFGQARQAEPHASHPPEAKRLRPDQDDTATTQASDRPDDNPRSIMPNPSEDITFPDTLKISAEIKNSLRRMHKNLAHPRPAELKRLLDGISDQRIHTAVESMSCDTCNRTKGPSRPAPSGVMADDGASQFADRVQMDIFYVRDLTGANHMILGVICEVTHLHLGFLLQNRSPEEITRCFTLGWARAFGFPLRIRTDPDGSIRAAFEAAMDEAGVYMDYVPPEAHNKIGLIERHNATHRSLMERVIEQQAVVGSNQMELTTAAAAHAKNSCTWSAGRPPYVAAFGRIPRQGMELLSDPHGLVTGQTRAQAQQLADTLRVEAQQQIAAMSVDSTFRRALLRNTAPTEQDIPEVGSIVAYWRWTAMRQETRVQIRKALRQASHNLDDNNIQDDTVPAPPEQLDDPDQPLENDDHELIPEVSEPALPLLVPQASRANQQAHHTEEAVQTDPYLQQQSGAPQVEYHLNVHSPTYKQTIIHHTPTSTAEYTIRHDTRAMDAAGSECPQASEAEVIDVDGLSDKTPPLQKDHLAHVVPSTPPDLALDTRQTSKRSSTEMEQPIPEQAPRASADFAALLTKHIRQQRIGNNTYILHGYQNIAKVVWDTPYDSDQDGRTILPERTNLITELWHEPYAAHLSSLETTPDGIQFRDHYQDGSEHVKMPYACHYAFQAYRAVPGYTGTGESSDSEASADDMTAGHQGTTKTLTRQEQKALDKEVPWQAILEMNQEDIDKYVDSAKAEETSWQQFNSVIPLTTQEASQVFKDPILKKRILRSRAAYRDKAKGQGPLKAKTRVVALGHLDPDLKELCRESATPTRQSEYVLYAIFIAGHNNMFLDGHDNGSYGVVTSKPHSCRGRQILVVFRCTCFLLKMG